MAKVVSIHKLVNWIMDFEQRFKMEVEKRRIEEETKILAYNLKKQNDIAIIDVFEGILKAANLDIDVNNVHVNKDNIISELIKRIEASNQLENHEKEKSDLELKNKLLEQIYQDLQTKFTGLKELHDKQESAYQDCTENLVKCTEDLQDI